ncbi:hypothetical protein FQA39_LY17346 [Lamprigera yunnana]|nr:hypothetical protein FQA39_LY17346 [Lamprigera yunnana]
MAVEIRNIGSDTELGAILNRDFLGNRRSHYIEVGIDKICLPGKFEEYYEAFKNFEVRDDDVFVCAFPKTGSRWTQEMIWLLQNNFNYDVARNTALPHRSRLLEVDAIFDKKLEEIEQLQLYNDFESPRFFKTHLHWSMLPDDITSGKKKCKIIVVIRGVEDTCTSLFYQSKIVEGYTGTFDNLCKLFLGGKVPNGPYWKHVLGMWEQRHRPNIMFLKYKEMLEDLEGSIRKVAKFLNKDVSDDEVKTLADYLKFDNLKKCKGFTMEFLDYFKDKECNPFARSGKLNDHKNKMSASIIEEFRKQRKENLEGTGLTLE